MATRAYHHGNLREELLDRAEATLAERGLDALSLRELAREVRGFAHLEVALRDARATQGTFAERFTAVASAYVTFATDHAALLELMVAGKHRAGADAVRAASDEAFAELFAIVAEGQERREIEAGDIDAVAVPLFAGLHGLATLLNGGLLDAGRREEHVAAVAAHGLRGVTPR